VCLWSGEVAVMDDSYTVKPHILRKDLDTEREEVAFATMDGMQSLIMPVSEEIAHDLVRVIGDEDMEVYSATVEEIEMLCAVRGLGTLGLLGLDGGLDMDVLDVETLTLVLEES
jgi:hypothetical protein